MKNGSQIDIDEMTIEHLRNTLKLIFYKSQNIQIHCITYIMWAMDLFDEEAGVN